MARKAAKAKAVPKVARGSHFGTRVASGKSLFLLADGRSLYARRMREVAIAIASDLGGMDSLSETQKQLVRRSAALSVACELMEGELSEGKDIDMGRFTSMANTQTRISSVLGIRRTIVDATPSLASYIAAKRQEKARKPPRGRTRTT